MNIAIIPARGGSKRIKNKNLIKFFDKPLIYYSILAAKKSRLFKKIIVSTDSKKIKYISEKYGASVITLRPKYLSGDKTKVQDVIKYEINNLIKRKIKFNYVCCIYPTAPLIQIKDIKRGEKKIKKNWDYVFSACKFEKSILRSFTLKKNKTIKFLYPKLINTNTQDLEQTYFDAGQFYWAKKEKWKEKKLYQKRGSIIQINQKFVQDIDYKNDLKILKLKYKKIYEK